MVALIVTTPENNARKFSICMSLSFLRYRLFCRANNRTDNILRANIYVLHIIADIISVWKNHMVIKKYSICENHDRVVLVYFYISNLLINFLWFPTDIWIININVYVLKKYLICENHDRVVLLYHICLYIVKIIK